MPFCASVIMLLAAAAGEIATTIVQAPDSPVRLDNARILTASDAPPVLLYSATNVTDQALDQFTVMAFVFDAQGRLKARQVAPGRRTLEPRATKYSAMVLDGSPIGAGDFVVVGINQAQRVDSDAWWRAELQSAAEDAAKRKKP